MAGNGRRKKSPFSIFSTLFKCKNRSRARSTGYNDDDAEYARAYKIYPSDEDNGRWVADPGIDRKAEAYISSTTKKWTADNY